MGELSVLGLDIAKTWFSAVGMDDRGKVLFRKKLRRAQVLPFFSALKNPTLVGIESCSGSNYWYREIASLGHEVKMVSPQFVVPFVKSNKNDMADAEAIAEAICRPTMRFVPPKSRFQEDIRSIHRIRERLVRNRTSLANEIRGLLTEFGVVLPQGFNKLKKELPRIIEEECGKSFSTTFQRELRELNTELQELEQRIKAIEERLSALCKEHPSVKRLMSIPGVGILTATALIAAVGDISLFRNSRQFAAWLGLVPRQRSTGGKPTLLGISKRGDAYLRKLLIHGARAVMFRVVNKDDRISAWARELMLRRGRNRATVALANKNARIVWALLSKDEDYKNYPVAA